jgi:hypothetical protein
MKFTDRAFILFLFARGAILYPATADGRPLRKISESLAIRSMAELEKWISRGITRFIFRPCDAGLLGLDADRKNGKDGVVELIAMIGVEPLFYIMTPSGGRHYYFLTDNQDHVSAEIRRGLEVKSRAFITVAASVSNKGEYVAHGSPSDIGPIPAGLMPHLVIRDERREPAGDIIRRFNGSMTLDRIACILQGQGISPVKGGRHQYAFQFTRFAKKRGHTPDEITGYLLHEMAGSGYGRGDIRATVQSLFRGGRA